MENSVCHTWCRSVNWPSPWGRSGEALPVLGTSGSWRNSHPTPRCSSSREPWAGLDDVRPVLGRPAARWRCSGPPGASMCVITMVGGQWG